MDSKIKLKRKSNFSMIEKKNHNSKVNVWCICCFLTVFNRQIGEFLTNKEIGGKNVCSPHTFLPDSSTIQM